MMRKLAREIASRKQAEQLLEQKSLELFQANQKLEVAVAQLEKSSAENIVKLEFQQQIDSLLIYFGQAFLNHHLDDILIGNLVKRIIETPLVDTCHVKLDEDLLLNLQKSDYGSIELAKVFSKTHWDDQVLHIALIANRKNIGTLSIKVVNENYELDFFQRSFQLIADLLSGAVNRQLIIDTNIESRKKAEKSEQATRDFVAMINHELRTPLNGLLGSSELLQQTPLDNQQTELVNNLSQSGEFLRVIINDLLDFSKINAGMFELIPSNFEFKTLSNTLTSIFEPKATEKSLNFTILVSESMPSAFKGDLERITQILVNLIGNAIKFTDSGAITVRFDWSKHILNFEVEDTGIGISEQAQKKLFQPFTQADRSSKRNFEGTGLGLAICHQLIELMGGSLSLRSELDKGTRFFGHIPLEMLSAEEARPKTEQDKTTNVLPENLSILVVEDIKMNQIIINQMLNKLGITPDIKENGVEALEAIESKEYHLVFMDCRMPVMDGFEATAKMRAAGFQGPILALTASTTLAERELCIESGMNDILTKPYRAEEISNALSKWLINGFSN
ncbi:ATP-binding protein [Vibrio agarivorans]|uniref:ATP-binding protein n=1 Tax=Vibrio agarivorans TaxID=153622 RepID=UPI0025B5157A|nr:ATP-binding protein [Vibrio agarivorans]MDN3663082.1 ATP-binding protein [Vibrio agarivorans]